MSGEVTPETPAEATPPVTPERLSRLKRLCVERCGGDHRVAKPMYKRFRGVFAGMKETTQDDTLVMMEAGLAVLKRDGRIPDARVSAKSASASAAEANAVLASIMAQSACAPAHDRVASEPVTEDSPAPTTAPTTSPTTSATSP